MWCISQEISGPVVDGNDPTGHIISTTIGGKNGEPKQVSILGSAYVLQSFHFPFKICAFNEFRTILEI